PSTPRLDGAHRDREPLPGTVTARSAAVCYTPRPARMGPNVKAMSEEPPQGNPPHRSWFMRIGQALAGEPQSREELIEELRQAHSNGLFSNDTLSMIEGAITVADLTVGDVMVPRVQMVSLPVDAPLEEVL